MAMFAGATAGSVEWVETGVLFPVLAAGLGHIEEDPPGEGTVGSRWCDDGDDADADGSCVGAELNAQEAAFWYQARIRAILDA